MYNRELSRESLMDYDDQMVYALNLLKSIPEILEYFQEKYQFISVDEAQDTSKVQYEIIRILGGKYKNIFMVGDEDQSIYGFRAAYPEALLEFKKTYPSIPWRAIKGLRNRIVHEYGNVDLTIVYDTVKKDIPELIGILEGICRCKKE